MTRTKIACAIAGLALVGLAALYMGEKASTLLTPKKAYAWGWTNIFAPNEVDRPSWFEVTRRFPFSEIDRNNFEGKKICFLGGFEMCSGNWNVIVNAVEVRERRFGPKQDAPPWQ